MEVRMAAFAGRWQDWINLALGAWLLVSPLLLAAHGDSGPAAINSYLSGAAVLVLAVIALVSPAAWQEWLNFAIGLWLATGPWLFDLSDDSQALANQMMVGSVLVITALWAAARGRRVGRY
jgi:hypothetical protein